MRKFLILVLLGICSCAVSDDKPDFDIPMIEVTIPIN